MNIAIKRVIQRCIVVNLFHKYSGYANSKCTRCQRFLSSSSVNAAKKYIDEENLILHRALEDKTGYQQTLAKPYFRSFYEEKSSLVLGENCDNSPENIWLSFIKLTVENKEKQVDFENACTDDLCQNLYQYAEKFSDDQLLDVLCGLNLWPTGPSPRSKRFSKVWNELDEICTARLSKWTIQRALTVGDLWYSLNLGRISRYNRALVDRFTTSEIEKLTKEEFVQFVFYVSLQRTFDVKIALLLQDKLDKFFPFLTMDEISVIALAFFKSQQKMEPNLLLAIIRRMQEELPSLQSNTVAAVAKILRYSSKPQMEMALLSLFDSCCSHVQRWDHFACIHLLLIMTTTQIDHQNFREVASQHLITDVSRLRIKDLSSLLLCLSMFSHRTQGDMDYYAVIVEDLLRSERTKEIEEFPQVLVSCLLYLAYVEVYPQKLLQMALSPAFVRSLNVMDKPKFSWHDDWFKLESLVRMERPHFLEPQNEIQKMFNFTNIPKPLPSNNQTFREKILIDVRRTISKMVGGEEYSRISHVLLQFGQKDIQLLRNGNKFVAIDQETNIVPNQEDGQWYYVFIGGRGSYSSNTRKPLGTTVAHLRQLTKMKFHVIEIPWFEYYPLSSRSKSRYLEAKLLKNFKPLRK